MTIVTRTLTVLAAVVARIAAGGYGADRLGM